MLCQLFLLPYNTSVTRSLDEQSHVKSSLQPFPCVKGFGLCRMSDASLEEEDSSGELSNLPNIGTAPIPEVEAVLRTADHWHFDAFKLTEASQGYPLSTLGFWLIQQNRVAKEFSESNSISHPALLHRHVSSSSPSPAFLPSPSPLPSTPFALCLCCLQSSELLASPAD